MTWFHWIAGSVLMLAWFSRIVDAALGMPKITDVTKPEWNRKPATSAGDPRVSIIVPACNEEETIAETLRRLLALDYENYEVIAVNDRSDDRTGEIMAEAAARRQAACAPYPRTSPRLAGQDTRHVDRRAASNRRLVAVYRRGRLVQIRCS
jgi:cellulose synthase/poly-beta-1,6-N-acetylglucosamine synthase-like glycosyltransferase